MKAESVTLTFTDEAIREIARIAYEVSPFPFFYDQSFVIIFR